jgi:hypothetical protein
MRTTLTAVAAAATHRRRGHRHADHGGCPQRMVGPGHHRRPGCRSHHRKRLRKAVLRIRLLPAGSRLLWLWARLFRLLRARALLRLLALAKWLSLPRVLSDDVPPADRGPDAGGSFGTAGFFYPHPAPGRSSTDQNSDKLPGLMWNS